MAWPTPSARANSLKCAVMVASALQAEKPRNPKVAIAPGAYGVRFAAPLRPFNHDHGFAFERVIKLLPNLPADSRMAEIRLLPAPHIVACIQPTRRQYPGSNSGSRLSKFLLLQARGIHRVARSRSMSLVSSSSSFSRICSLGLMQRSMKNSSIERHVRDRSLVLWPLPAAKRQLQLHSSRVSFSCRRSSSQYPVSGLGASSRFGNILTSSPREFLSPPSARDMP